MLLPPEFADQIEHLGSYAERGDRIHVVGRFAAASRPLAGEPAIDADVATIAQAGAPIDHAVPRRTMLAALVAAATATVLSLLARREPRVSRHRPRQAARAKTEA